MSEFFIPRKDLLEINCSTINSIFFAPEGAPGRFSGMRLSLFVELLKKNGVQADATEIMFRESASKCTTGIRFNAAKNELTYE